MRSYDRCKGPVVWFVRPRHGQQLSISIMSAQTMLSGCSQYTESRIGIYITSFLGGLYLLIV